eukprot:scaffold243576_cov33-Tisochrysis_lutea.AAC.1
MTRRLGAQHLYAQHGSGLRIKLAISSEGELSVSLKQDGDTEDLIDLTLRHSCPVVILLLPTATISVCSSGRAGELEESLEMQSFATLARTSHAYISSRSLVSGLPERDEYNLAGATACPTAVLASGQHLFVVEHGAQLCMDAGT